MDSIVFQLILQLPVVALIAFAAYLLRSIQRERNALSEAIEMFESRLADLPKRRDDVPATALKSEIEEIRLQIEQMMDSISEVRSESDKTREYMGNQKTALKEFGRVLSKTSEQTYSELQNMDERLNAMQSALGKNGIHVDVADAA